MKKIIAGFALSFGLVSFSNVFAQNSAAGFMQQGPTFKETYLAYHKKYGTLEGCKYMHMRLFSNELEEEYKDCVAGNVYSKNYCKKMYDQNYEKMMNSEEMNSPVQGWWSPSKTTFKTNNVSVFGVGGLIVDLAPLSRIVADGLGDKDLVSAYFTGCTDNTDDMVKNNVKEYLKKISNTGVRVDKEEFYNKGHELCVSCGPTYDIKMQKGDKGWEIIDISQYR